MMVRRSRGRQRREGAARVRAQRRAVRRERAGPVRPSRGAKTLSERVCPPGRPASRRVPRAAVETLLLAHARLVRRADRSGRICRLRAVRAYRGDAWWATGEVRGQRRADVEAHVREVRGLRSGHGR